MARAFVAIRQAQHPYRGGDRPADAVSQKDRERAAVATVYLGLGAITVNAAHTFRQEGEIVGNYAVTYRTHMVLGALPAADLAFLLAVQLVLRGEPLRDQAVARHFESKWVSSLFVGLFAAMVPALVLLFGRGVGSYWTVALLLTGAALGAVVGSRRRVFYCGACGMLLRASETSCPKCAARLEGEMPLKAAVRARLEQDDDDDDELARQALEHRGRDFGEDGHV